RCLKAVSLSVRRLLGLERNAYNPAVLETMRRDWDERARQNARYYVATGQQHWTDQEFFRSGREWVEENVLSDFAAVCADRNPGDMKVLEIGCGAGRMTYSLSQTFGMVYAVDVSPEMVARARSALRDRPNVGFHINNGVDLSMFPDAYFD